MDCVARIEKLENGYSVEVTDPAIVAKNNSKGNSKWQDPCKEYAFPDLKSLCKWLMANEEKLSAESSDVTTEFTAAWNEAKGD